MFLAHHHELVFSPSQSPSLVLVLFQLITDHSGLKTFDPKDVCNKDMHLYADGFDDSHRSFSSLDILFLKKDSV